MSDITLVDGDLFIAEDGDLVLNSGIDAVIQHLRQRLKTGYSEWFLDRTIGVPYLQHVLIKNFNPTVLDSIFKSTILDTPGIDELVEFDIDLDESTRIMTMPFKAIANGEEINFNELLGVI